ncbi:hypothetical protein K490DRAFT_66664 [Saccharata proteae CBS 121410]|uniref:Uncharacterized protein n=1 Tax=Saccharata proteae CBS 121410 TaxID=1314787 RepID=A0A9P4HTY0_9PEZI|nr:hypothetical protein K490DRAFT_66664 [Saccharata proteae CBS 121410]
MERRGRTADGGRNHHRTFERIRSQPARPDEYPDGQFQSEERHTNLRHRDRAQTTESEESVVDQPRARRAVRPLPHREERDPEQQQQTAPALRTRSQQQKPKILRFGRNTYHHQHPDSSEVVDETSNYHHTLRAPKELIRSRTQHQASSRSRSNAPRPRDGYSIADTPAPSFKHRARQRYHSQEMPAVDDAVMSGGYEDGNNLASAPRASEDHTEPPVRHQLVANSCETLDLISSADEMEPDPRPSRVAQQSAMADLPPIGGRKCSYRSKQSHPSWLHPVYQNPCMGDERKRSDRSSNQSSSGRVHGPYQNPSVGQEQQRVEGTKGRRKLKGQLFADNSFCTSYDSVKQKLGETTEFKNASTATQQTARAATNPRDGILKTSTDSLAHADTDNSSHSPKRKRTPDSDDLFLDQGKFSHKKRRQVKIGPFAQDDGSSDDAPDTVPKGLEHRYSVPNPPVRTGKGSAAQQTDSQIQAAEPPTDDYRNHSWSAAGPMPSQPRPRNLDMDERREQKNANREWTESSFSDSEVTPEAENNRGATRKVGAYLEVEEAPKKAPKPRGRPKKATANEDASGGATGTKTASTLEDQPKPKRKYTKRKPAEAKSVEAEPVETKEAEAPPRTGTLSNILKGMGQLTGAPPTATQREATPARDLSPASRRKQLEDDLAEVKKHEEAEKALKAQQEAEAEAAKKARNAERAAKAKATRAKKAQEAKEAEEARAAETRRKVKEAEEALEALDAEARGSQMPEASMDLDDADEVPPAEGGPQTIDHPGAAHALPPIIPQLDLAELGVPSPGLYPNLALSPIGSPIAELDSPQGTIQEPEHEPEAENGEGNADAHEDANEQENVANGEGSNEQQGEARRKPGRPRKNAVPPAGLASNAAQRFQRPPPPAPPHGNDHAQYSVPIPIPKTAHNVIDEDDRILVVLADMGCTWHEVNMLWRCKTGKILSDDTIPGRYRRAKKHFNIPDTAPRTGETSTGAQAAQGPNQVVMQDVLDISDGPAANRPTAWGKGLNADAMERLINSNAERAEREEAEELKQKQAENEWRAKQGQWMAQQVVPPVGPNDCWYGYEVMRKEWTSQQDESEVQAIVVGPIYTELLKANHAAGQEILQSRGLPGFCTRTISSHMTHVDGMIDHHVTSNEGHVKVFVKRELRNTGQAQAPRVSKSGWLPNRVWSVIECDGTGQAVAQSGKHAEQAAPGLEKGTRPQQEDDTDTIMSDTDSESSDADTSFGGENSELLIAAPRTSGQQKSAPQQPAAGPTLATNTRFDIINSYTVLDMANRAAVRRCLELETNPASMKINDVQHRANLQRELNGEADRLEGLGQCFDRVIPGAGVRVWVKEGQLNGPRNI